LAGGFFYLVTLAEFGFRKATAGELSRRGKSDRYIDPGREDVLKAASRQLITPSCDEHHGPSPASGREYDSERRLLFL
jgi:hypothetical protein